MKTRKLGNSDLKITPVGFGAWAVGGPGWEFAWGPQDDKDSIAAIHKALEMGVNWIDTAAVYGLGHSENVVARALKEWRGSRPYIFTKCSMRWNEQGKIGKEHSAASIRDECEDSLQRLQVNTIDLYQMHWPPEDNGPGLEEAWQTLAALKRRAKPAGLAFPILTRHKSSAPKKSPRPLHFNHRILCFAARLKTRFSRIARNRASE